MDITDNRTIFFSEGIEKIVKDFFHFMQIREDIQTKKNFSIRALPELSKPPPPNSTFCGRQKRRFARMAEKNTDNNCCHDNFDQNFGNFDDNDDKKY